MRRGTNTGPWSYKSAPPIPTPKNEERHSSALVRPTQATDGQVSLGAALVRHRRAPQCFLLWAWLGAGHSGGLSRCTHPAPAPLQLMGSTQPRNVAQSPQGRCPNGTEPGRAMCRRPVPAGVSMGAETGERSWHVAGPKHAEQP